MSTKRLFHTDSRYTREGRDISYEFSHALKTVFDKYKDTHCPRDLEYVMSAAATDLSLEHIINMKG